MNYIVTTPHVPGNRLLVTWNVINKSIEVSKKLDQMRAKYCIDESRIYFAGHSVDAAATYKLAVTRTTRPAAGVAMSGRDRQTNDMFPPTARRSAIQSPRHPGVTVSPSREPTPASI